MSLTALHRGFTQEAWSLRSESRAHEGRVTMYIGGGLLVVILIVILVVLLMRR